MYIYVCHICTHALSALRSLVHAYVHEHVTMHTYITVCNYFSIPIRVYVYMHVCMYMCPNICTEHGVGCAPSKHKDIQHIQAYIRTCIHTYICRASSF